MSQVGFVAGLPCFLLCAAFWDWRYRTIPNLLTGTMALCGVALSSSGHGLASPGSVLLAGAVSLFVGLMFQLARFMGGGDVKLFAALALWLGPAGSVSAALATAIAGGAFALFFIRRPTPSNGEVKADTLVRLAARLQLDEGRDFERVPYGVAVAAGGLWVWWSHVGFTGGLS